MALMASASKLLAEAERGAGEKVMSSLMRMATPPPIVWRSARKMLYPRQVMIVELFSQVSLMQRIAIFCVCRKLMRSGSLWDKLLAFHRPIFKELMLFPPWRHPAELPLEVQEKR